MSVFDEGEIKQLFISSGKLDRMYTLRVVRECRSTNGIVFLRDEYWCNLATDWTRACEKASNIAEELQVSVLGEEFSLDEIRRSKADLAKEAAEEIAEEMARREASVKATEVAEFNEVVQTSTFVVGKYRGRRLDEVIELDPAYVYYLASMHDDSTDNFGKFAAQCKFCHEWVSRNPMGAHSALPGELIEVEARILGTIAFNGTYGISYLVKLVDAQRRFYNVFTTSKKILGLDRTKEFKFSMVFDSETRNGEARCKKIKLAK